MTNKTFEMENNFFSRNKQINSVLSGLASVSIIYTAERIRILEGVPIK